MPIQSENLGHLASRRELDAVNPNLSPRERLERQRQADGYRQAQYDEMLRQPVYPLEGVLLEPLWSRALNGLALLPERTKVKVFAAVCVVAPSVVVGLVWLVTR